MSNDTQDLKKLFSKKNELRTLLAFNDELSVTIRYVDHAAHVRMLDASKNPGFSTAPGADEDYDNDKYWMAIAENVETWDMTYGFLEKMTNVMLPENIDRDEIIVCNQQNVFECMNEMYGFSGFLVRGVTELVNFQNDKLIGELKNSETSLGRE